MAAGTRSNLSKSASGRAASPARHWSGWRSKRSERNGNYYSITAPVTGAARFEEIRDPVRYSGYRGRSLVLRPQTGAAGDPVRQSKAGNTGQHSAGYRKSRAPGMVG